VTGSAIEQTEPRFGHAHSHTTCRVCGHELPEPYLDLGNQPLANGLLNAIPRDQEEPTYPLAVCLCQQCGLSQLTVVVDPKVMYTHYRFSSGISNAWHAHCEHLSKTARAVNVAGPSGLVVDIAANDGTQLLYFKRERWRVLGVEPSDIDTVMVATPEGEVHADIPMIRDFWSGEVAKQIRSEYGFADLVIAQNVFGHVDDAVGFLKAVKQILSTDGKAVLEVPDADDMLARVAFDTIYHEHLSYWSRPAVARAASRAGLRIHSLQGFPDIHGGTVRYWLQHEDAPDREVVRLTIDPDPYKRFAHQAIVAIDKTASIITSLDGKKVLAWGASAKGAVMMNALHNRWPELKLPAAVIDQTPEKHGLLTPGVHIPVVAPPDDVSDVDVLWVLSWNWLDTIKLQAEERGFKGKYLVTSPQPRLL
jgi:SAM-dependent methyltransferase